MNIYSIIIAILLLVSQSWALPKTVICDSEDKHDQINKYGKATFTFTPFSAVNLKQQEPNEKVLFAESIVCGRDISNMTVKPTCSFVDKSEDNYLQIEASCNQEFGNGTPSWYSVGNLIITDKASGQFNCHLKYPDSNRLLTLTNCISQ